MKSWAIFSHSIRQVFGNLSAALRVSGLIYLVMLGLIGLTVWRFMPRLVMMMREENLGELMLFVGIILVISLFGSLWIGVAWHRYVLLVEQPGLLPKLRFGRVLAYFGTSILIGLLLGLVIILPGMLLMRVIGQGVPIILAGFAVLWVLILGVVSFRLSAVLPGAALASGHGIGDAWQATKGETPTLIGLVILFGIFSFVLNKIGDAFLDAGPWPFLTVSVVTTWISMMVGFSILTILYGHYIEKRPLV